jgi:cytochrome P450
MLTAENLPVDRRFLLNPLQRRVRDHRGFPVAPGAFPVLGHLPMVAMDYLGLVRRAEEQLGPFFWINQGFGRMQLTCLLPEVFSIFKNKVTTSTYVLDILPDLYGGALIAQDGPAHQHVRSAMNAPFQPRGLAAAEIGTVFAELIARRVRSWSDRGELQILAETRELVLSLMFRMIGAAEAELALWRHQYEEYTLLALNVPIDLPGSPRRRGRRARAWLNERLLGFIRDARARPDASGLLAALVHARDEEGALLSDAELVDNLRLLVLAGHETSASTMAWMVIELAQRPDVWERLCAEARAAGEVPRTPSELRRFPFAEAVFRETLRLYPPVTNNTRQAITDLSIGGRTVQAGSNIAM